MGPARMIAESLTLKPGIREHNRRQSGRGLREKAEAVRRARKAARKQAQREGLIPMPKRRDDAPRRAPLPRLF